LLQARAGALAAAEEELRGARDDLAAAGLPFLRARCELHLGQLVAERGDAEEAEQLVAAARETFARLGATAWLARVERERPAATAIS
jgi:hypothetical protein